MSQIQQQTKNLQLKERANQESESSMSSESRFRSIFPLVTSKYENCERSSKNEEDKAKAECDTDQSMLSEEMNAEFENEDDLFYDQAFLSDKPSCESVKSKFLRKDAHPESQFTFDVITTTETPN
jgi:hypothetical protein